MWNMAKCNKNSYLHSQIKIMNPALLNQCVDIARVKPFSILTRRKILNSQLVDVESQCFGPTVEKNKANLAYGLLGLPKIMREISSKDTNIQFKALNRLSDLLINPLECNRAINDFNVVDKLEEILLVKLPESRETSPTVDKTLENFEILATHFEASWRMVAQYDLMKTLYTLIINSKCNKKKPAIILMEMSTHPTVADVMLIHGHLKTILYVLRCIDNIEEVYIHLANLIKRTPEGGMEAGFFDFLIPKMCINNNVQPYIMKCIGLLLSTPKGHELFDKIDGIKILYGMLKDKELRTMTLEYVALAIQNCTINKRALWRCREFWDLPVALIRGAHSRKSFRTQLYCIQALRQITTMPSVKDFVRKTCKKQIKDIECLSDSVKQAKENLLEWLRKKNYKNCEPKTKAVVEEKIEQSSSEYESESCVTDSDESSKIFESDFEQKPKPIAYRLDYGKICPDKGQIRIPQTIADTYPHEHKEIQLQSNFKGIDASEALNQTHVFLANRQKSNVIVDVADAEVIPQGFTIREELQRVTAVASQRTHELNNVSPPETKRNSTNLPHVSQLLYTPVYPEDILTTPRLEDLPALGFSVISGAVDKVTSSTYVKTEPFIYDTQRVIFVKGPPQARVYYGFSKHPLLKINDRRHAVSLEQ